MKNYLDFFCKLQRSCNGSVAVKARSGGGKITAIANNGFFGLNAGVHMG